MNKKYEAACREAGLSEEAIQQIRRVFERDKEKMKYEREQVEKYGYYPFYFCENEESRKLVYELVDNRPTIEENYIHQYELERLQIELKNLSQEDRDLLLAFYDQEVTFTDYVKSVGGNRSKLLRRKEKLLKKLRENLKDLQ